MNPRKSWIYISVLTACQLTVLALAGSKVPGATNVEAIATFSKAIDIGTPPISTFAESGCNVEGSLAPTTPPVQVDYESLTDPVECQWNCQTDTECRFYSWNTSAAVSQRCALYSMRDFNYTVLPGNTGVFFSQRKDCYAITNENSTNSRKFPAGGQDMWINTGINDCGVEGTASYAGLTGEDYQFDTILECQTECDGVNACHSYFWDTTVSDDANNCHLHSGWISEYLTPDKTGIYYSDSTAKMNNECFRNKSFATNTKRDTPTSTMVGLPAITSTTNALCNIEGSFATSTTTPQHYIGGQFDVLDCMYTCQVTTFCQAYSWNMSDSAFADGNNCGLWAGGLAAISIDRGSTGLFFSAKSAGCNSVVKINSTSSVPFIPEKNVWVNTAVDDCSIEGTASDHYLRSSEGSYIYDSVLTCQKECDTVDGCTSYSWTPSTGSCRFWYSWLAGEITPGETGVYFSDGLRKTGNPCYSDKPFGT